MQTKTTTSFTSAKMLGRKVSIVGLLIFASGISAADCKCGPLYCKEGNGYAVALAEKKAALLKEYPPRLVSIVDRVRKCEGCIRTSPDGFSIMRVAPNGDKSIKTWRKQDETDGARATASGALKQCLVIYARQACSCADEEAACGTNEYAKRKDYDRSLDLNTDMAITCSSTG
jgi:hypothetical protein